MRPWRRSRPARRRRRNPSNKRGDRGRRTGCLSRRRENHRSGARRAPHSSAVARGRRRSVTARPRQTATSRSNSRLSKKRARSARSWHSRPCGRCGAGERTHRVLRCPKTPKLYVRKRPGVRPRKEWAVWRVSAMRSRQTRRSRWARRSTAMGTWSPRHASHLRETDFRFEARDRRMVRYPSAVQIEPPKGRQPGERRHVRHLRVAQIKPLKGRQR